MLCIGWFRPRLDFRRGPEPFGAIDGDILKGSGANRVLTCERHQPAERVKLGLRAHAFGH